MNSEDEEISEEKDQLDDNVCILMFKNILFNINQY